MKILFFYENFFVFIFYNNQTNMELLGWIATSISIIGILLNANKNILCWPVWLLSNIAWILYFILVKWDLPSIVLWIVFAIFNVYGWVQWKKDKK